MTDFRVTWVIDLMAESAEGAAIDAFAIQKDRGSIATVFDVQEMGPGLELGEKIRVDLLRLAEDLEVNQEILTYRQTHGVRPRA